eukprot:scaffold30_cov416-Prasinococcus_capsulatus_cf.AAC.26
MPKRQASTGTCTNTSATPSFHEARCAGRHPLPPVTGSAHWSNRHSNKSHTSSKTHTGAGSAVQCARTVGCRCGSIARPRELGSNP